VPFVRSFLAVLFLVALAVPPSAGADTPVCDPSVAPSAGAWSVRWGTWAADALEPPFHVRCDANGTAARLTTATLNAIALEWPGAAAGSTVREGEVSFLAPSLDEWSHIALFAAYDPISIGRVGADVFHETDTEGVAHDRLTVQINPTVDADCAGSNLHAPVPITAGIVPGHWYRIGAGVARRKDGGLRVTGTLRDLGAGDALVASTSFDAPPSCTPSWFPDGAGWGIGLLGFGPGVETVVDDFAGFAAPPPPPLVTFTSAFDDALAPWLSVHADPDLSAAIVDGALAIAAAPGAAAGEARVATAFAALGDFTAEVEARRTTLGAGDVLGLRITTGTGDVAVALVGADAITALADGAAVATVADATPAVTLRLARTGTDIVAEAETDTSVRRLTTFTDVGGGGATIELFLGHVPDAAAPPPSAAAAGAFDDLAIVAEQLALTQERALVLTTYRAAWDTA